MKLDHISAGLLFLLWRRRRNGDGSLIPANVLHLELLQGLAKVDFRSDLKVPAVKKSLRQLKKAGMVEYGDSTKTASVAGPAPKAYRLSADPPIITWRASAAIVILLHNHPERRLKREAVIAEAVSEGLTHHNRDQRLEPDEISELIDWCIRKGYMSEEDVMIDERVIPTTEKLLITTSKVDDCGLFLQKIAGEVKRQVSSEQTSSATDAGALGKLG